LPEHGRSILRQEVGRVFEEARLAWDRLNPEPPLSEFNSIACELGAFADFPIGDRGESISIVVCRYISDQFVKRRAAGLLKSSDGRLRVGCIVATIAGSLQTIGVNNTRPLWDMADILRRCPLSRAPRVPSVAELKRVGVMIVSEDPFGLKCDRCAATWSPSAPSSGTRLRPDYWQCPKGCNKEAA